MIYVILLLSWIIPLAINVFLLYLTLQKGSTLKDLLVIIKEVDGILIIVPIFNTVAIIVNLAFLFELGYFDNILNRKIK